MAKYFITHYQKMGSNAMNYLFLILVILLSVSIAHGESIDRYPFASSDQQKQFQNLMTQFRCLVCQNQDLADSNADLAKDLRQQVYLMVLESKTDNEIKQYMTQRYGNFILFKPPFKPQTWLLWLLPFLLLMIGFVVLYRMTQKRGSS